MNDLCRYTLQLRGLVSEGEINALSPLQMTAEQTETEITRLTFSADQSGLVGLLRHLHGLGFVILAMNRVDHKEGNQA